MAFQLDNGAAQSIGSHVQALIERDMAVPDADFAARCLTHIGFHRLMAYWWPFQAGPNPNARFRSGASFDWIMTLYMFDQRFRSLLLEALSYVEISIRNQWSHQLVQKSVKGDYAHLDAGLFNPSYYSNNLQELERNYNRVRGQKGPGFQSATIWELVPTMPFGNLSKWYSSLTDRASRQSISVNYGIDETTFRSALRHLTSIRNTCAHHERIWNLTFNVKLRIPREMGGSGDTARAFNKAARGKVYNALVIIIHLMEIITPNGDWPERLCAFMESAAYRSIRHRAMGFPEGWREFAIWKRHMPQVKGVE